MVNRISIQEGTREVRCVPTGGWAMAYRQTTTATVTANSNCR